MARTAIHPGKHLADKLKELRMSAAELARQIDVSNQFTCVSN
jgi:plasmid maintenance system antidote protein VapI